MRLGGGGMSITCARRLTDDSSAVLREPSSATRCVRAYTRASHTWPAQSLDGRPHCCSGINRVRTASADGLSLPSELAGSGGDGAASRRPCEAKHS